MGAEVDLMLVSGTREPLAWPGNPRRINQPIILQEAHKDTTEHPRCSHLRDVIGAPLVVTLRSAFGCPGTLVLASEYLFDWRHLLTALQQIRFKSAYQGLQIGE